MKSAYENQLTGDQFFLTRQTANLMEGFVREFSDTSSIFLLYGKHSVGKSWLLRELSSKRIRQANICWIDFKLDGSTTDSQDVTSSPDQGRDASDIQGLMEAAAEGDIIFVDHFEDASNKARHQLFQSWTTDGMDKKLNLVIATSIDGFNEVRQLAQQNQVEVKSFELSPYSAEEIEAFLGFYLFPEDPLLPLSIPAEVSKQIENCNGIIGKVASIAALHKDQITQQIESESTVKSPLLIGSMISVLIVVGALYWYLQPARQSETMTTQVADSMQSPAVEVEATDTVEAEISSPPESDSESEQIAQSSEMPDTTPTIEVVILEPVEMQETESPVELEQDNPPVPEQTEAETEAAEEAPPPEPEPIVEAESPPGLEPNVETEPDAVTGLPVEPGPTEKSIAETTLLEDLLADNTTQYSSRFQHELANSLDWIEQNDKGRATIQLMLLGFAEFTENTYYDYIDRLKRRDIDLSRIKIYPTVINDIVVYGVIYGEYENRVEAKRQIQNLPEALEADRPIPRTFGGIWSEITQQ